MSRYLPIDTVVFEDPLRGEVEIKDRRSIPSEEIAFEVDLKQGDLLDEIATRRTVYGSGGETQVFRIFDANTREIFAAGLNLDNIKRLKIPRG